MKRLVAALATAMAVGSLTIGGRLHLAAESPGSITAISICGAGTSAASSCPDGTADTQEVVLAAGTSDLPLNEWNVGNAVDEHSSVFPPYSLGGNTDYVFFVASGTQPPSTYPGSPTLVHDPFDIGVVVLSGRPGELGQWRMTFAPGYGSLDVNGNVGPVFLAPTGQRHCPTTLDRTFDLNYAAPGSVVADPTGAPGSLLMFYEGADRCDGSGSVKLTLGVATSADYGQTWPAYAPTPSFVLPPLPYQNTTQGPNVSDNGAFGNLVCIGVNCTASKPYAGYGRYPVLSPPKARGTHDEEPAAFLDNVHSGSPIYLYTVQNYEPAAPLPDGRAYDMTIARALLNGGSGPLVFEKWNGQSCGASNAPCWVGPSAGQTLNDAEEYSLLKDGDFTACGDPASQVRSSPSVSYVKATQQYLLTFVCKSPGDPARGPAQANATWGGAWFFATSRDLSDPNQWSTPVEIIGSWNAFPPDDPDLYNGWYPTFMSLEQDPGRLTDQGYAFYLWGREGGGCEPDCHQRRFTSRRFAVQTTDNVYSRPPVAAITGPVALVDDTGSAMFTFRSNEPGSAFECALNGSAYLPCLSPTTYSLDPGTNAVSVRAINPFGMKGPTATRVINKPVPIGPVTP